MAAPRSLPVDPASRRPERATRPAPSSVRESALAVEYRPLTLLDAPEVFALMRACRAADGEPDETSFAEFVHASFQLPTANIELDSVGAARAGRLVGYGWAFGRGDAVRAGRVWLLGGVHPEHRRQGIGRQVLRHGIRRASELLAGTAAGLPRHVDVEAMPGQTGRAALLVSEGFAHVRTFTVMHCVLPATDVAAPAVAAPAVAAPAVAAPAVPASHGAALEPAPAGLVAVDWRLDLDAATRDAHNEAFADHWGSEPVSEERWRHLGPRGPGFRPDLSSIAVAPDGTVAGYVLASVPPGMQGERATAWIGTVGVRPAYRGRGLATELLRRSLAAMEAAGCALVGLDVDADNPTGAVRVYERLGFRVARTQWIYSRRC